jgi:general nucleoside transport system permease protein
MIGLEAVILTVITAATPLLLAALGELVSERSGVLNLGVEGMMVMGAVCGFGAAFVTCLRCSPSPWSPIRWRPGWR